MQRRIQKILLLALLSVVSCEYSLFTSQDKASKEEIDSLMDRLCGGRRFNKPSSQSNQVTIAGLSHRGYRVYSVPSRTEASIVSPSFNPDRDLLIKVKEILERAESMMTIHDDKRCYIKMTLDDYFGSYENFIGSKFDGGSPVSWIRNSLNLVREALRYDLRHAGPCSDKPLSEESYRLLVIRSLSIVNIVFYSILGGERFFQKDVFSFLHDVCINGFVEIEKKDDIVFVKTSESINKLEDLIVELSRCAVHILDEFERLWINGRSKETCDVPWESPEHAKRVISHDAGKPARIRIVKRAISREDKIKELISKYKELDKMPFYDRDASFDTIF